MGPTTTIPFFRRPPLYRISSLGSLKIKKTPNAVDPSQRQLEQHYVRRTDENCRRVGTDRATTAAKNNQNTIAYRQRAHSTPPPPAPRQPSKPQPLQKHRSYTYTKPAVISCWTAIDGARYLCHHFSVYREQSRELSREKLARSK